MLISRRPPCCWVACPSGIAAGTVAPRRRRRSRQRRSWRAAALQACRWRRQRPARPARRWCATSPSADGALAALPGARHQRAGRRALLEHQSFGRRSIMARAADGSEATSHGWLQSHNCVDQRSCLLANFLMNVMLQHLVTFIVLATEFPQSGSSKGAIANCDSSPNHLYRHRLCQPGRNAAMLRGPCHTAKLERNHAAARAFAS